MAINDNITVMAGKKTPTAVDVDTKSTILLHIDKDGASSIDPFNLIAST